MIALMLMTKYTDKILISEKEVGVTCQFKRQLENYSIMHNML